MKKLLENMVIVSLIIATSFFIGCGEDKGNDGGSSGGVAANLCGVGQVYTSSYGCLQQCANQPGYGYEPTSQECVKGTTNNGNQCSSGQVYVASHGCLNECSGQPGYGYDPVSGNCFPGTAGGSLGLFGNIWGGRFQITDKGNYRDFLEEYGQVCNPIVIGWNFGISNCDSWDDFAYLYIETTGTALPANGAATIYAYPASYSYYNYYVPISVTGTFQPINNNSGFELRTTGGGFTPSYNEIIRVVADPGSLTDNRIRVYLYYDGKQMGYAEVRLE